MNKDFEANNQRYAVCMSQWAKKEKGGEEMIKLGTLGELIRRANRAMGKESSKKYSTETRKKMKESTFCGPGRSFPIADCQHVGTARAYLNRSKFSASTKAKIAACINKKAKALGCGSSKKEKSYLEYSYESLSDEQKKLYDSEVFKETQEFVEQSIKNPGLDLDFANCESCV